MLWALVMRGTSSSEKSVTPRSAVSRHTEAEESGSHMPTTICPGRSRSRSADQASPQAPQVRTPSTQSAVKASSRVTIVAPVARYSSSAKPAAAPAPDSTRI
ncbi:MAG: hypothetical protein EBR23_06380, partial [Planctomycetia bacterium]|nr:hypothetical protein [Planctomycetia bacterium]